MAFQLTQRDLALLAKAVAEYHNLAKSLSTSGPDEFSEFELRVTLNGHQCHIGYGDNGAPAVLLVFVHPNESRRHNMTPDDDDPPTHLR